MLAAHSRNSHARNGPAVRSAACAQSLVAVVGSEQRRQAGGEGSSQGERQGERQGGAGGADHHGAAFDPFRPERGGRRRRPVDCSMYFGRALPEQAPGAPGVPGATDPLTTEALHVPGPHRWPTLTTIAEGCLPEDIARNVDCALATLLGF
eukprot:111892-Prorocentrum_minimum.AAC.6